MDVKGKEVLLQELKKCKLCRLYWSEQIAKELEKEIVLEYEPVGEMGVFQKQLAFRLQYGGENSCFLGTEAIMDIKISAYNSEYNIQKASEGIDCFHNIQIKVVRGNQVLLTCKYRLWSEEDEEYCGSLSMMKLFLDTVDGND